MKNNLYDLVFEADDSNIRSTYFTTLENINEFARINAVERTLLWVRIQLEETMQTVWLDENVDLSMSKVATV